MYFDSKREIVRSFLIIFCLLSSLFFYSNIQAGGLSCSVGEVVINNLKIGQTYSLKTLANLPLSITNTSEHPVVIQVEPLIPATSELRQGAEAIPDNAWASAHPASFELGPKQTKVVEIILSIPEDEALFNRKFQVNFWSHTLPQPGNFLAYGLSSRVIFSIDQVRELPGSMPQGDLSISLLPAEITLANIKPGKKYRLEDFTKKPLVVKNSSSKTLSIELQLLAPQNSASSLTAGYTDLLSCASVKLFPHKFTLNPGEEKKISGTVFFPKGKSIPEKKLMAVISAVVVDQAVQTQIYSRIYAHLK